MATELAQDISTVSTVTPLRASPGPQSTPGGFWIRGLAFLIDIVTIAMIYFPLGIGAALLSHPISGWPPVPRLATEFLIIFAVIIYPNYRYGGSPGKLLFDLRLIDSRTGSRPPLHHIVFRETIGRLISTLFFGAGFLNSLCNKHRETWHDLLGRTQVIHIETDDATSDNW